mmetsp:Transcript_23135/g.52446  ORF Transcript_23135/g.52446 Transcript_23135/m.52446 type:complete len:205 (+) Transcript_23135:544-1158(+)
MPFAFSNSSSDDRIPPAGPAERWRRLGERRGRGSPCRASADTCTWPAEPTAHLRSPRSSFARQWYWRSASMGWRRAPKSCSETHPVLEWSTAFHRSAISSSRSFEPFSLCTCDARYSRKASRPICFSRMLPSGPHPGDPTEARKEALLPSPSPKSAATSDEVEQSHAIRQRDWRSELCMWSTLGRRSASRRCCRSHHGYLCAQS